MELETIASGLGIALAWFISTLRVSNAQAPRIDEQKRSRKAKRLMTGVEAIDKEELRQTLQTAYISTSVSARLLDRMDKIELDQMETEKRVAFLTHENLEKTKKIDTLQKEVRALKRLLEQKGHPVSTDELKRLVDELPDGEELTEISSEVISPEV